MADYKLRNSGVIRAADGAYIPNDERNSNWLQYQQWVTDGNTPDQEYTIDELRDSAISKVEGMVDSLVDASTSNSPRKKRKSLARSIMLLRKELKSSATQAEIDELDADELVAEYMDNLELSASNGILWINDQARTIEDLVSYDPAVSIMWPTAPA